MLRLPRTGRLAAMALAVASLSACNLTSSADVSGCGSGTTSVAAQRAHQDAIVLSNVLHQDLANLSSVGSTCEGATSGHSCADEVSTVRGAVNQAVADLAALRVPASMKPDVAALKTDLQRTLAACDPVAADTGNRIAEAYAANEFDTAVQFVVSDLGKIGGDANNA